MSGTAGRPPRVTLSRDAVEFVDRVEALARKRDLDDPALHHWVATACERPFLARTIAREADVLALRHLMKDSLATEAYGPRWPRDTVIDLARDVAVRRGDRQVRAWHLVLITLQRFGIAARDAEDVVLPAEEPPVRPEATRGKAAAREALAPFREEGGPAEADAPAPDRRPATATPGSLPAPARPRTVRPTPRRRPQPTPLLDACGTDWTLLAARGELPPCVGREAELRQLVEGLCRLTKPNVLLVGEPGVGKSAIVEGLAQLIADGRVPDVLAGRPLIALSLAEINRDSRYYGVMEQRLAALIEEARAVRAILFLDEGHAMVGSGGREGTGDVASVLKPALARGDLSLITATTEDEYRRFIAPNGALERRFNVVPVLEPDRAAVRTMIAAHRAAIAAAHGIGVTDAALDRLLEITATRLSHRREPDRSRDLLDQAVARAIAAGADAVSPEDVELTARAVSGAPDVTDETLAALRRSLTREGVLTDEDADALADRLGIAYAGLALRPARPRAVALLLRRPGGPDGFALAEAVASHVFGASERVVSVDVGGIREPSAISGFIGTTQGYIGHGAPLPIHALADRPHSVLLLRGVDAAHEALRSLLARALRDGYLTDAGARRIPLTTAVIVLEAAMPSRGARTIGFGTGSGAGTDDEPRFSHESAGALAEAAVGEDLAGELDLVAVPPAALHGAGMRWVSRAMARLAAAYRLAGVELAWDADVEAMLGDAVAAVPARDRERVLEASVGRVVRPCLRSGRRPSRARVRREDGRLVAESEAATTLEGGDVRAELPGRAG